MKTVILAGGFGTRISEESNLRPKPMIEVGGKPLLWHIMKTYTHFGFHEFIVCCGYKGYVIKDFFANYFIHQSDVTFDLRNNTTTVLQNASEPWTVTVVDTGLKTMTGGRLRRVREYLNPGETFFFTYGDGVSDVDLADLLAFHRASGKKATLTAVQPPGRYGAISVHGNDRIRSFKEKPKGDGAWVNGGFFVLEPSVIDLIAADQTVWEREPLEELAQAGELMAYKHRGFWMAMDTLRDRNHLEELWASGEAPWKRW